MQGSGKVCITPTAWGLRVKFLVYQPRDDCPPIEQFGTRLHAKASQPIIQAHGG
jgi:hypothetical protein